ncbi:MAG: RecX family transcriptional regulator [Clostridia bacterium]|nr:RecX family transcriptional regulator [Clostridia bacterium]
MAKKKMGASPLDTAFDYLTSKPRTIREVELHLDKCDFGEYEIYAAIERLKELNYVNDEKYAADFIESRLNTKPVSRRKLFEQLRGHLIDDYIITEALKVVTRDVELENARQVAEKFARQFSHLEEKERETRIIKRLISRGYDYNTVKEIMGEIEFSGNIDFCEDEFDDE